MIISIKILSGKENVCVERESVIRIGNSSTFAHFFGAENALSSSFWT